MSEIDDLRAQLATAVAERDNWIETARMHAKNETYYRDLIVTTLTGTPAAFVSDDGSVQQDVLCAKLPELYATAVAAREEAERLAFFWERCDKRRSNECWPWRGTINPTHGYGEADIGPRGNSVRWRAHRFSYELFKGRIAEGLVVMHTCDNRACVNPRHLSVGTVTDNNRDMARKGRQVVPNRGKTHCKRGHAFDGANLYVKPNGNRQCRACASTQRRRYNGV